MAGSPAAPVPGPQARGKSTSGVVELSPFAGRMPARRSSQTSALATTAQGGRGQGWHCRRNVSWTGSPIWSRRRGSIGIATTACSRRIIGSGKPLRHWPSGMSASGAIPRRAGMRSTVTPREAAVTRITRPKSRARTTPRGLLGQNSWREWGRSFRSSAQRVAATSGREASENAAPASPAAHRPGNACGHGCGSAIGRTIFWCGPHTRRPRTPHRPSPR